MVLCGKDGIAGKTAGAAHHTSIRSSDVSTNEEMKVL
jgi:hypothetical protein